MNNTNVLKKKLTSLLSLGVNPQLDILEIYFRDFIIELFQENCLTVNGHKILIRDIELSFEGFYSDKIIGHEDQLKLGRLFFHKKDKYRSPKMIGVDITAGNGRKHGTIFIRGIEANGQMIQKPNAIFWYILELLGYTKDFTKPVDVLVLQTYDGLDLFSESSPVRFETWKSMTNIVFGPKEKMVNKDLPVAFLRAYSSPVECLNVVLLSHPSIELVNSIIMREIYSDQSLEKETKVTVSKKCESQTQINSNYKMAQTRYRSIEERSFDKDLDAFLYMQEFKQEPVDILNGFSSFCFPKTKEEEYNRKRIYTIIENEYENVQVLRDKNKKITLWEEKNIPEIKILKKEYRELFSQRLSLVDFFSFFKTDDAIEYRKCGYCDLSERDAGKLFEKEKIFTKRKYSRGRSMEVDKIDPNGLYEKNNISLCCYWCNNAKSDEFDEHEFKEIGVAISKVWQSRLKNCLP